MKPLLFIFFLVFFFLLASYIVPVVEKHSGNTKRQATITVEQATLHTRLQSKATMAKQFALQVGLSSHYAVLIDMRMPSGKARLFLYDFTKDSLALTGLVAHGSCNTRFLAKPRFSNASGSGYSALGHYKIGSDYTGRFGKAFKLFGLDSTNSNAYQRNIVLHAYQHVPDSEVFPYPVCNSLGCPMVSAAVLKKLAAFIANEKRPLLLWMYE